MKIKTKDDRRVRIQLRQRKRISGTTARPRLNVFRSVEHIYAQVIDDTVGKTVASANTTEAGIKAQKPKANAATAVVVGKLVAERALAANVKSVVFDRGGFIYHGKVKALADAAREAGLQF